MRILIVDDELPIREWLKMSISALEGNTNEVCTAPNGKDAWEMFSKEPFDMVVTDIKMPKMGGLELLQKIKDSCGETYVVMLTSYSEFEYAREAIKYQANEYVLKNEITAEVLGQIMENYHQSKKSRKEVEKPQYIKDLLTTPHLAETFPVKKKEGEHIFAAAFAEKESDKAVFESFLNAFVLRIEPCFYEKDISVWVCSYKNSYSTGACFGEAMAFCKNLALLKETGVGFSGFTEEIPEACQRARMALNLGFYENRQGVFLYKEEDQEAGLQKIKGIRKNVISMIRKDRQEEAKGYIADLYKELTKAQVLDLDQVRGCFTDMVDAYKVSKMEFAGRGLEELCRKTRDGIEGAGSLEQLRKEMDTFLRELKGTMVVGEKAYSEYVKSAIAYTVDNYAFIESLTEVADYVNINADYFCRLFKAETGSTYNSYLTNCRIQKAVELLTNTDLKVYEVAEKVGYSNLSYFSRVFKKVMGVNPFFYQKKR